MGAAQDASIAASTGLNGLNDPNAPIDDGVGGRIPGAWASVGSFGATVLSGFTGVNGPVTANNWQGFTLPTGSKSGSAPKKLTVEYSCDACVGENAAASATESAEQATALLAIALADVLNNAGGAAQLSLAGLGAATSGAPVLPINGAVSPPSSALRQAGQLTSQFFIDTGEAVGHMTRYGDIALGVANVLTGNPEEAAYRRADAIIMGILVGGALETGGVSLIPAAVLQGIGGTKTLNEIPYVPLNFVPPYPY